MLITLLSLSVFAQDAPVDIKVDAQVRPRFEAHTGRDGAPGGEAYFVSQRSRIGATLSKDALSLRVVVQDVRLFGEEGNTLGDYSADGLDVHFGYLQYDFNKDAGIRLGRQEFILHEHRLIGNVGWLQQARAFNGARAWYGNDKVNGEVAAALTATPLAEGSEKAAGMGYARVGTTGKTNKVDAVYIWDGNGARSRSLHTAGVYALGTTGAFSGRAEAYYQMGSTDELSVSGFMAGVRGTFAPDVKFKPKVTLWYDYLSGNGDDPKVKGAFDTLYATNHKFYGLTDVPWFKVGATADGRGLQDGALKFQMSPAERLVVKVDGHVFLAADAEYIGFEPDLVVGYKVNKHLSFASGMGAFVPAEADTDLWGFFQVDVKL